jgi:hypothetical protein
VTWKRGTRKGGWNTQRRLAVARTLIGIVPRSAVHEGKQYLVAMWVRALKAWRTCGAATLAIAMMTPWSTLAGNSKVLYYGEGVYVSE